MIRPEKDQLAKQRISMLFNRINVLIDTIITNNLTPTIPFDDYNKLKTSIHEFKQKHLTNNTSN